MLVSGTSIRGDRRMCLGNHDLILLAHVNGMVVARALDSGHEVWSGAFVALMVGDLLLRR